MIRPPDRVAICIGTCLAALCTACGSPALFDSPSTGPSLAPQAAMGMVAVGRSTKADVLSALGNAIVIPFDSGHEVWVYRWTTADRTPRSATELVVLFAPSGVATKLRLRPGAADLQQSLRTSP